MQITDTRISKRTGQNVKAGTPKVSVIIPAYNVAEYIEEALDSVFAQTFEDFEVIIINDGSPDTEEFERVLEKYFDRIIYLKQENAGCGPARNVAIQNSRGALMAFLDGDDVWLPGHLESQIAFLETHNYDLVYSDAHLFGNSAFEGKTYMELSPSEGEADFESLLDMRCNVLLSSSVTRRQSVEDAGMFEWKNVRAQDFHLWLRMAHRGARIGYQKKLLLKYRVRVTSLSGDSVQRIEREIDVFHRVMDAIKLSESQQEIVEKHFTRLEAEREIERGKSFLLRNDFTAAREAFEKANEYRRSNRLKLIIWMARIAPKLLLSIYRSRRDGEIELVPGGIKIK